MIVTKVEPLSKTKYKIYLNHQFAFVLYKGELRSYKISDGRELSEEELDEIREKILLKRAKKRAMHLLEDMDRSEAGLREKLKAGLYPEDLIEAAVTYVKSFGYLNDVRYAENFILARKSTKSKREILALLNRKGICSADIEKAFESCYGESEEVEAVRRILAKKKVDVTTSTSTSNSFCTAALISALVASLATLSTMVLDFSIAVDAFSETCGARSTFSRRSSRIMPASPQLA